MHLELFIAQLGTSGMSIFPNFISPAFLKDTKKDLDNLFEEKKFSRAGIGHGKEHFLLNVERNDETCWLERSNTNSTRLEIWRKIDTLKTLLNRNLYLGISSFEGHYAVYPAGGFYRKHLDSFRNKNTRIVSFILYLNHLWKTEDGGCLRIHEMDGTFQDIEPIGGTLVCFMSEEKEHEVLTSYAERFSLTGWYSVKTSPI